MLSYMLPTEEKPPAGERQQQQQQQQNHRRQQQQQQQQQHVFRTLSTSASSHSIRCMRNGTAENQYHQQSQPQSQQSTPQQRRFSASSRAISSLNGGQAPTSNGGLVLGGMFARREDGDSRPACRPGAAAPLLAPTAANNTSSSSAGGGIVVTKLNGIGPPPTATQTTTQTAATTVLPANSAVRKPTLLMHAPSSSLASSLSSSAASAAPTPPSCFGGGKAVAKDDSLHSIESETASNGGGGGGGGSERKGRILNGPGKHANLKRVSFGSSKGSMVETLVYETPVQEEPEINHFHEHNGRLTERLIPVPDTDEGREKVRVSLLGHKPFPSTPGVLLLEPIGPPLDIMSASPAELLTAHADHTIPTYHTQISTDSGWDNPFRPDGDLSREADEIVELIKGGKPITPTPGQNGPALPGYDSSGKNNGKLPAAAATANSTDQHDSSTSPLLLDATNHRATSGGALVGASPKLNQGNGNAHSTPIKPTGNQQSANEKNAATVDVGRLTAQGPGDASQVEHVTLKKKPKCKCCVLQ